jgi:large repetitive protein
VISLVFTFATGDTLASTTVLTQGATGLDFADAGSDTCTAGSAYSAGQSCSVNVTFAPRFAGNRLGAVVLVDTSGNTIATGHLQGIGFGPQISFLPGVQSTLGSGLTSPASVALDGSGDVYFTEENGSILYEMLAVNGAVPASPIIKAIASGFGAVAIVTVDSSGNLYVADTENNEVKEIFAVSGSIPASPTIQTLGSGFIDPAGIAVDASGNVYVSGLQNGLVQEIVAVNGSIPASPTIRTLASGFSEPVALAVDGSGNVYVASVGSPSVKEILAVSGSIPASPTINTLGSGFSAPYSVALDGSGDVYVADYGSSTVKEMVAVDGSIPASPTIKTLGSGFSKPGSVSLDGGGNIYVADTGNNRVEKLDVADAPSLTFAATAVGATSGDSPRTITIENAGNAALTFPIPSTGNNPSISSEFTLNSGGASDCVLLNSESSEPATLAEGASCQLPISFSPTAVGAFTGSLVLTDNNLNAAAPSYTAQSITLSGTGTGSFTLGTSASSLTLTQGSSAPSTITVTGQNGFTGNVNLSASGLPYGVTASFSPNSTTGTSVLTLTASSVSSLASSATITISGTSGSLTETTTLLLTVNPGPSFSLGASPASLSVNQGTLATATITIASLNGFNGQVNLTASGLPAGVTASFTPNPATGTSLLTLSAAMTAATGNFNVTISGNSGTLTSLTTLALSVVASPNFTINSSVSSGGLSAGYSLTSTITVNPIAGFNGSVNLTVSGLTSGLTASFTPNPTTGTSLLTITASSTAPTSEAFITVTGTSGTLTVSTLIEVDVVAQPTTFSLVAAPVSLSVVQGGSGTTAVTVMGQGGFNGNVTLATGLPVGFGLPSGVTASFSPNSTTGTSTLTIAANNSAVPASYNLAITGTSGTLTATAYINLTINPAPGLTPSTGNFGSVNIGTTTLAQTFAFTFGSADTLASASLLTQGATGLDFANAGTGTCAANTAYAAGQTCTVNVTFTPEYAGTRIGALVLNDTGGNVIATGYLQGTGVGPQVNFLPGTESTLASGFNAPAGTAVDGSGNIYVADYNNNAVEEILAVNGSIPSTPAINTLGSGFNFPTGVAVDGTGNVYVADWGNSAVKEILAVNGSIPASPTINTLGSGFNYPSGVAVDSSGNVFVADQGNNAVKEIVAINGSIPASPVINTLGSSFSAPKSVAVDSSGNVYVSDYENSAVKEILAVNGSIPASPTINTLVSTALNNGFAWPGGIAVDGRGDVVVANDGYDEIDEIQAVNGAMPASPNVVALGSIALNSGFNEPWGVTVDGAGNVFVADTGNNRLVKLDFADPPSLTFATTAVGSTSLDSPQTVTVENIGNAALSFPILLIGNNPVIATNFTLNGAAPSSCSQVNTGSSTAGTLAAEASCQLSINFTPTTAGAFSGSLLLTDNNLNAIAPGYTFQSIALSGTATQATPSITWRTPAAINYGTALSGTQLNATSTIAGTFSYSPVSGTLLTAGQQTLTVTFTPTDIADYTTATATVTLTVSQATPAITWPTPSAITYGTALSATQLNASSTVAGSFAYSPALGTIFSPGTQELTATFTPTDTVDYSIVTATVLLTVNTATPTINWPTPAAISYGTALSATQLNASSTVAGTFAYSPAIGSVLNAGAQTLKVTFRPTNTTDYTTATATVVLIVNKATPAITWHTPAAITYGTALSATQLDASSTVAGTFAYSPAVGSVLNAGAQTLTVNFTPTNTTDYTSSTDSVVLTVNPAPSFTLSASPTSLSIAQGASGTATITLTPKNGFSGNATLTATGLPSGAAASLSTNPITGTSILKLTASSTATVGTATVTITATSGSITASTTVALTVTAKPGFACHVAYTITSQWPGGFGTDITINNTGTTAISNWTLTFAFANGQTITQLWNGNETQNRANVTVTNMSYNGSIPAGGSYNGMGFNGSWNNITNAVPTSFAVNGTTCK